MTIKETIKFFKSLGFVGKLNDTGDHFIMDCRTDNSHFDVQGDDNGHILIRLIGRKHIEDFLEINDFNEKSFDIVRKTLRFWDNF